MPTVSLNVPRVDCTVHIKEDTRKLKTSFYNGNNECITYWKIFCDRTVHIYLKIECKFPTSMYYRVSTYNRNLRVVDDV